MENHSEETLGVRGVFWLRPPHRILAEGSPGRPDITWGCWRMRNLIRDQGEVGFWLNQVSRILAKIGQCRDAYLKTRSGKAE